MKSRPSKKATFLGGSALIIAVLCSALFLKSRSQATQDTPQPNAKAIRRADTPQREEGTSASSRIIHPASDDDLKALIDKGNREGKLVIVDFFATWCPPCKALGPVLEALAAKYPSVIFAKIDIEKHQDLAESYKVTSIPHVLFISCGDIKTEFRGFTPEDKFSKMIDSFLAPQ